MEQEDAQNLGHDREGLSKRRPSSILKVPRTSMKALGNDQDENQEETRPIEKQRNSRRVSFATTNNVRVFPKDVKAEAVLAPIQNVTLGANEGKNERVQCFDSTIKYDTMGLDTTLTQPIHFKINKENFFPDPSLPVDSTVVLGEDTGHMDMTYSHTVGFDKLRELDPEFTLNMSNVSQCHQPNVQNGSDCRNVGGMETSVIQSQFYDFLGSLPKTGDQNVTASFQKESTDHFASENSSETKLGEENVLQTCLPNVEDLERDDMDLTTIHPLTQVVLQHLPYSISRKRRSTNTTSCTTYSDDMELCHNQTDTINFKGLDNTNRSTPGVNQKTCTFVCDDPSEMTKVLDEYVQEPEQLFGQNRADHFQSSASLADSVKMEVLQSQTAVSKTGDSKRNTSLATHDQSDFMELTCQASTEVLSHIHEGSMVTECSNVTVGLKHNTETYAMVSKPHPTSVPQLSDPAEMKRELSCFHVDDDMEMTCDDMDVTLCPTVVKTKSFDDYKSKKRLSRVSTSYKTGTDPTSEHTGCIEVNRYSFSKIAKTGNGAGPSAQTFLRPDAVRNCPELQQGNASDMTIVHDDMELTGFKTTTIDTKTSWLKSSSNKPPNTPCAISSRLATDKMKRSGADLDCSSSISLMDLDARSLADTNGVQTTDKTSKDKSSKPVIAEAPSEDSDMVITTVFTAPLENQCVAFIPEMARETMETATVTSDQRICKETESDSDSLNKEHSSSGKCRQRTLADLQMKLRNISQSFREPDGSSAGSVTAPLVSLTAVSPVGQRPETIHFLQSNQKTQLLENRTNSAHKEDATPFKLKNSLMARLPVRGITPKFPPRTGSANPNQSESKSPNCLLGLQPQTGFSSDVQNGSGETNLVNEVLPENDFSGTLVSCLSKSKMPEGNTGALLNKDCSIQYDRLTYVPNISQSEEIPPELKDRTMKDSSEKLHHSNFTTASQNASTHVVKATDHTNSSSNTSMMKLEGISELSLKNSQLDSQFGGSMDEDFDFYKKFEEGSVTVNEFLTYFGAKFVIHRSRPSALPDIFSSAQTWTFEDLLRERYIHRPKQKVYETDCQHLFDMAERFKTQMADQDKPLRSLNGTLLRDVSAFSKDQLQRFGSKLKEHRGYFRKRNQSLSHRMKEQLYAELLKTTQDAKQNLTSKIKETNKMLNDLDSCINDLDSELARMNHVVMGDQHSLVRSEPALKSKQERLDALNSEVAEKEKQICRLQLQAQSLEGEREKVQDETRELECRNIDLNSLNEWRVISGNENRVVFTFLHDTVELEVKHNKTSGNECMKGDVEVDISFRFQLNDCSEPSAIMVHKLLTENNNNRPSTWTQKYSTTQSIPMLLHDVSVVVSRLRLLGEEIHRLKRWGGVRLGILHITCVDTVVEVMFSSVRAFVKFELSLAVTPDYPFRPLQLHTFQNHIGDTRLEQIKDIVSSVKPAKNYLTTVMKRIHSDLLG